MPPEEVQKKPTSEFALTALPTTCPDDLMHERGCGGLAGRQAKMQKIAQELRVTSCEFVAYLESS